MAKKIYTGTLSANCAIIFNLKYHKRWGHSRGSDATESKFLPGRQIEWRDMLDSYDMYIKIFLQILHHLFSPVKKSHI